MNRKQMHQAKAKIIYNKKINGNFFHLALQASKIAGESSPGQFVNIKVNDNYEPLLRRPLSIHRANGSDIEVLYEVVGKATQVLSQRSAGEYLDIIGPLGNGFDYKSPGHQVTRSPVLVAGGMGVAPLVFLAEKLVKSPALVLIGAKTKEQIICERDFKDLGCDVRIATDDGSRGFGGYVSGLLEKTLMACDLRLTAIYACGPRPMLKEVTVISGKYNVPAQLSLEEHMACGIGACLGCVVNTREGFKRVCKEGPVFRGDEITW